jgi:heme/copper-type cytochrome/quinol oxidase subunit 4
MRMSRETKFGYGFLLAGIGVPYLMDKLFGGLVALVVAALCTVIGIALLIAGYLHLGEGKKRKLSRTGIAITAFIFVGAIMTLTWAMWKFSTAITDSEFYGTVTGWGVQAPGAGPGGEGFLDLNMDKLLLFKDRYQLLVVARIHNTRVNSLTDPTIQKSDAFPIGSVGTTRRITVPFSQQFLSSALSILGPEVEFEMYLCLIPRGLDARTIATLDDITAKRGHVFWPSYGGGAKLGPTSSSPR